MAGRPHDPIAEFNTALAKVREQETVDVTACTLATADAGGRPSARTVLLKGADERGFVFHTNYESRKAHQLAENPWAALCFYWTSLGQQVRVEGPAGRVSAEESDAYFATRPRASQIGAWASRQSQPLSSRGHLVAQVALYEARFAGRPVPRPDFWGGYRILPERIEFWWNRLHRLHDRRLYTRRADGWHLERLYP
jgi:pyridoxamine 5'-phosphate oxidase